MCRCKDMPECAEPGCERKADCDTGGFCYEHDPLEGW